MGGGDSDRPSAMAKAPRRRTFSTRLVILALIGVLVVPGIAFAGLLLIRYAEAERARYQLESVSVARAAATVLDRQLDGLKTVVQTLATSDFLERGDMEAFYRQAMRVRSFIDADIGLRELDGQQVVNTRAPWGTALPFSPLPLDGEAIASGQPVITDVFTGAIAKRPLVAITTAVRIEGKPRYLLHISAETDRFHEATAQVASASWLIGIADRKGVYITRSENHAEFTGKPGNAAFLAQAANGEGTFIGRSAFGQDVLVGFTHSDQSDWLVAASIRQDTIEAPMRQVLYILVAFGFGTLLITSLIALRLWRSVARPLAGLTAASRRIGTAEAPSPVTTRLREFAAVGDALAEAARQVRQQNELLEARVAERTQELATANAALTAQIEARAAAEDQLRQVQKMEAVGQLTGGIAHDFNNMLSVIISSLDLLQRRIDRGETDVRRYVLSALEGAERAATLTRRLLAFSRQQSLAPQVIDANQLVAGMSELLRRTLGESIRTETVLAANLWRTHADAAQVENAILNLSVNARDAMPEGGRLTIETANVVVADGETSDDYVQISVSDTGTGMPPEVIARAFDPFFTTKRPGMGTGLGLSQVYGFVTQSNGHVRIESAPGNGTTIRLHLPRHAGEEPEPMPVAIESPLVGAQAGETILVVEDEEKLRRLTVDMLRELGYTVHDAGNAADALALLARQPAIDLLFTDVMMPDVNGRRLAREAVARRRGLRVLFMTGFARDTLAHDGVLDAGLQVIPKPFASRDLAARIRDALAGPPPTGL